VALSRLFRLVTNAKAVAVVKIKAKMEINMKTTINTMCVVVGTNALLGWSGDMLPKLQGNAQVDIRSLFEI